MSSSLFKKYNETIELSLSISYQQPVPRLEVYIWGQLAREVPPDSRESELLLSFGSFATLVLTVCSGWTDSQHPLLYWNGDHGKLGFSATTAETKPAGRKIGFHTSTSPGLPTEEVKGQVCSATGKRKSMHCYASKENILTRVTASYNGSIFKINKFCC